MPLLEKLLKTTVVAFFGIATAQAAIPPKTLLISGYDDVLRQAENTGLVRGGLKLFEKDQTFAGMPELYAELTKGQAPRFALISATSRMFLDRIRKFLGDAHFPDPEIFLRSWLGDPVHHERRYRL